MTTALQSLPQWESASRGGGLVARDSHLRDMLPFLAPDDIAYMGSVDAEQEADSSIGTSAGRIKIPHSYNLFCGQLSAAYLFAPRSAFRVSAGVMLISALRDSSAPDNAISLIFLMCFTGQMIRITARWVIAGMSDRLWWPFSRRQEMRDSMRSQLSLIIRLAVVSIGSSFRFMYKSRSLPLPAIALWALAGTLVNLGPKYFDFLFGKNRYRKIGFTHRSNLLNRFGLCVRAVESLIRFPLLNPIIRQVEFSANRKGAV